MNEHISCPVCSGTEFIEARRPFYYRGKKEEFKIDSCASCGFWFTNPYPEGADLAAYYDTEDYVSHTDGKGSVLDVIYGLVRSFAIRSKYKLVKRYIAKGGRLIDYGAGTGEFLAHCQQKGLSVQGFEPSAVARENAAKKGLTLNDPAEREHIEDLSVDVFSLWHVMEHIPDLNETWKYFHRKLKNDGALIIAVPNHESYDASHYKDNWAAFDVPLHLWHFAKKDIKALGVKHGFEVVGVRNMPFDSFYVSLLSEKNSAGSTRPLNAFFTGLRSNIKGTSKANMSSLIYILRKV